MDARPPWVRAGEVDPARLWSTRPEEVCFRSCPDDADSWWHDRIAREGRAAPGKRS
jgi:hypothetical protein